MADKMTPGLALRKLDRILEGSDLADPLTGTTAKECLDVLWEYVLAGYTETEGIHGADHA